MQNINVPLFRHLMSCAVQQKTITYTEAARAAGLPESGSAMGKQLGAALDIINTYCLKKDLPPLSVLVVRKSGADRGRPGLGFWLYMERLGIEVPVEHRPAVHTALCNSCFDKQPQLMSVLLALTESRS